MPCCDIYIYIYIYIYTQIQCLEIVTLIVTYYKVSLICLLWWFNTSLSLSEEISLVNLTNILKCFLINVFLLIGQKSVCNTVDINP